MAHERLPRSVAFPRGLKVPVRLATDEMMIAVGGSLDDGQWNAANNTIYIRKALSSAGRIEVFYHEMHHCVTDMEWAERCVIANRPVSASAEKSAEQLALPLPEVV